MKFIYRYKVDYAEEGSCYWIKRKRRGKKKNTLQRKRKGERGKREKKTYRHRQIKKKKAFKYFSINK